MPSTRALEKELFVTPFREGYVEIGPEKFYLPSRYETMRERIDNFQVRAEDVFVTGHPKTGTTWLHEMVYMLANDLDYESAKIPSFNRLFFIDFSAIFDTKKMFEECGLEYATLEMIHAAKSPRCIKTHLLWDLLPLQIRNGSKNPKIINIVREPKDVCVSLYYHSRNVDGYIGSFEDFCKLFLAGKVMYGPFFSNIRSYWKAKERSNILFLNYKDMKRDLSGTILRVAAFLGKTLSKAQLAKLTEHLDFNSMKRNPAQDNDRVVEAVTAYHGIPQPTCSFFRRGEEGTYKLEMVRRVIEEFDSWTQKNISEMNLTF